MIWIINPHLKHINEIVIDAQTLLLVEKACGIRKCQFAQSMVQLQGKGRWTFLKTEQIGNFYCQNSSS